MKRNLVKKVVLLLMSVSLLIGTTGCGSKVTTISDYKKNGKITMGTNVAFPPFEYYDGGNPTGFDIELSQKIADKIGVELVIEDMEFDGLISSLAASKIDFIAAGLTADDERRKSVDFSQGYYESSQVIIVMKDNQTIKSKADLTGKKIGVQIGTTGAAEAEKVEGAIVSPYNAGFAAIMDMKSGKLDAIILDYEPAKKFAEQNAEITILDERLTTEEYAIAVRKGETELQDLVNQVITEMKENGEYDKLIQKYFEQ